MARKTRAAATPALPLNRRAALVLFGLFLAYVHFELFARLLGVFDGGVFGWVGYESVLLASLLAALGNAGLVALAFAREPRGWARWAISLSLLLGLAASTYFLVGYVFSLGFRPLPFAEAEDWRAWMQSWGAFAVLLLPPLALYATAAYLYGGLLWRLIGRR